MKLEWLGHACFAITTSAGTVIVTDPYDETVGYDLPDILADAVTISHKHHDHDCLSALKGHQKVFDCVCDTRYKDIHISSIQSYHDDAKGIKRGGNLIFSIESDNERIVHLGDLGHMPDTKQFAFIQKADVLLIPVGGYYTIDTDMALRIIEISKPNAAVAMHFKNRYCAFPISTAERFTEKARAKTLSGTIAVSDMSGAYVFEIN